MCLKKEAVFCYHQNSGAKRNASILKTTTEAVKIQKMRRPLLFLVKSMEEVIKWLSDQVI